MPTTIAKLVGVLTFLAAGTDICAFCPLTLPSPPTRRHGAWDHAQQAGERGNSALTIAVRLGLPVTPLDPGYAKYFTPSAPTSTPSSAHTSELPDSLPVSGAPFLVHGKC
jgi:hypothetical protein